MHIVQFNNFNTLFAQEFSLLTFTQLIKKLAELTLKSVYNSATTLYYPIFIKNCIFACGKTSRTPCYSNNNKFNVQFYNFMILFAQ